MRTVRPLLLLTGLALLLLPTLAAAVEPPPVVTGPVVVVRIDGPIGPATSAQVLRGFDHAAQLNAQAIVLALDTPGGLDGAMREIIKAILAAPRPVVGFVSPPGARAASAGTYLMYAAHVAAMAPATNLGAATPIEIGLAGAGGGNEPAAPASAPRAAANDGDTLRAKRINDATAYIHGLAQLRGRNAAWAEQAVREAVSLSAEAALRAHVIDLVARDVPDLLRQLDGREVALGGTAVGASGGAAGAATGAATGAAASGAASGRGAAGAEADASATGSRSVRLATAHAPVVTIEPDWHDRLLGAISNPSLALLLLTIGLYGLLFEMMSPGMVAPGVIGGVCLLLALWGLQMLPVNAAGAALVIFGLALFVTEAFIPSYGVLGLGGFAGFAFGALLLIDTDAPGFGVPVSFVFGVGAVAAAAIFALAALAARSRRVRQVGGTAPLLGAAGEVIESSGGRGWALVAGERWQVRSGERLAPGQAVRVRAIDGLTLDVGAAADSPTTPGASR